MIPSGVTVTGTLVWDGHSPGDDGSELVSIDLPGVAPAPLTDATVNFASSTGGNVIDGDDACQGDVGAPTAPSGKVCIYIAGQRWHRPGP